jgi:hypothetical protein
VKASADNKTTLYQAYPGIVYAADHGAHIINCSFTEAEYSALAADAVAYAAAKGCILFAGAGNSGTFGPAYPADLPGMVSVGSCELNGDRSGYSSYGPYVAINAPGSSIISTEFNDTYGTRSGTSMSTPMVSGAAALLKAKYPQENRDQIIARILATADTSVLALPNNKAVANQVGAGRLNVARALSYRGPSFKVSALEVKSLSGQPLNGSEDTVVFHYTITNYLQPSTARARLRIQNVYDGINNPAQIITLGRVGLMGTIQGTFKQKVPRGLEDASLVLLFTFRDSGYTFTETRIRFIGPTVITWAGPGYTTTSTSNGRIGYLNRTSQGAGVGVRYKGVSLLYEAGFLFALGGDTVYSTIRGANSAQNKDFRLKKRVQRLTATDSIWKTESLFTDTGSTLRVGLQVRQRAGCSANPADSNIIFYRSVLKNMGRKALRNAYWGLYADWDLAGGGWSDQGGYAPAYTMPYIRSRDRNQRFGIVPLSRFGAGAAVLNNQGTPAQANIADGWLNAEKNDALRSGTTLANQQAPPALADLSILSSIGPFTILPQDSVELWHAIVFGPDSVTPLAQAQVATETYAIVTALEPKRNLASVWQVYPNPAKHQFTIETA